MWGLDFGDCHKSFFAHADSVMSVGFIHNTHYVFSCGKDGLLKYWDVDRFELITQTQAHYGEVFLYLFYLIQIGMVFSSFSFR